MKIALYKNAMANVATLTLECDWKKNTDEVRDWIKHCTDDEVVSAYKIRKQKQSLFQQIAEHKELAPEFESISQHLKELKAKAPALIFSLSAEPDLSRPKKETHKGELTGFITIDIDHISPGEIAKYKKEFLALPFVFFVGESFSGFGCYAVCVLDCNEDNYTASVEKVQEIFKEKWPELKGRLDKVCKDCTRLRFLALDPDIAENQNITPFSIEKFGKKHNTYYITGIDKHFDKEIRELSEAKDNRHESMGPIAIRAFMRGKLTKEQILQALIKASEANGGNHVEDVQRQVEKALVFANQQNDYQAEIKANNSATLAAQNYITEKSQSYCFDKATTLYFPKEFKEVLDKAKNYHDLDKFTGAKKQDELIAFIMREGQKDGIPLTQKQVAEGIYSQLTNNADKTIDSFEIRVLKLVHYAQIREVGGNIEKFCKEQGFDKYESRCFKKTLIAICAKALQPSVLHQQMLIFSDDGQQGLNKTKFWNSVAMIVEGAPAESGYSFENDKDQKIKKTKHCLVLLEECENLDKKDSWILKREITEPFCYVRLPYDRDEKKFWNRAVFVGLTNKDKMLNANDEKARRFWIVKIKKRLNCDKQTVFNLLAEAALIAFDWLESFKGINYLQNCGNVVNEEDLPPWADLEEEKIETIQKNRLHKNHDNVTIAIITVLLNIEDQSTKIRVNCLDEFANWIVSGGILKGKQCCFTGGEIKEIKTYSGRFVSAQMVKDRLQERIKGLAVPRKNSKGKSARVVLLPTLIAAFRDDYPELEQLNNAENEIDILAEKDTDFYKIGKEGENYVFV